MMGKVMRVMAGCLVVRVVMVVKTTASATSTITRRHLGGQLLRIEVKERGGRRRGVAA